MLFPHDYVQFDGSGTTDQQRQHQQQMPRVEHQTSHRSLNLPKLEDLSQGLSGSNREAQINRSSRHQGQGRRRSRSHKRSRSRSRASHTRNSQLVQQRRSAKISIWGELKHLINRIILGRKEVEARLANRENGNDMAGAKARAEKASNATPVVDAFQSQVPQHTAHSIQPPPAVITRSKWEAMPGMYPEVPRKPLPMPSPGHPVRIREAPSSNHKSLRARKQMPSNNTGSARSNRSQENNEAGRIQSCITQLGDFMIGPDQLDPTPPMPPPKDDDTTFFEPCSFCGCPPASDFALDEFCVWLCSDCRHPASPFEAPPNAAASPLQRSAAAHNASSSPSPSPSPSSSSAPFRKSMLSRTRSPLSMVSGSRRASTSDVSDFSDNRGFLDDGEVSPLSPTVAPPPLRTGSREFTAKEKEKEKGKGKRPGVRCLPPLLPAIDPVSPMVKPQPRVTSSVYPEDEALAVPDVHQVPLPPIPAKFRDQRAGRQVALPPPVPATSVKGVASRSPARGGNGKDARRRVSSFYPADDEDDESVGNVPPTLPPLSFGKKKTKKGRVGRVRERERDAVDSDSGSDNRRSSFYGLEGEIISMMMMK